MWKVGLLDHANYAKLDCLHVDGIKWIDGACTYFRCIYTLYKSTLTKDLSLLYIFGIGNNSSCTSILSVQEDVYTHFIKVLSSKIFHFYIFLAL